MRLIFLYIVGMLGETEYQSPKPLDITYLAVFFLLVYSFIYLLYIHIHSNRKVEILFRM